jgi:hypothetical protein
VTRREDHGCRVAAAVAAREWLKSSRGQSGAETSGNAETTEKQQMYGEGERGQRGKKGWRVKTVSLIAGAAKP